MPEVAQGSAGAQTFVSGNNIRTRNFAFTVGGVPVVITSARFAARDKVTRSVLLAPTACAFAGNIVTRPAISGEVTAKWPSQVSWDIEVSTSDGDERTWVRGDFVVKPTDQ